VAGTTTETVSVKRVSDNFYLQAGGTFSSAFANCFSRTNALAAVAGEYGVYSYAEGAGSSILYTNFTAIAAP
jgi:hypothetical protein